MTDFATYPSLRDRTVFVSGGAAGIGGQTVRRLARQGARVGFVDVNEDAAAAIRDELADCAHAPAYRIQDIKDVEGYQRAIRELAEEVGGGTGGFYGLINNAAHDDRHDWREVTADYWDDRQAVNIRHQFFAIQAIAPMMMEGGGGSIANIGSTSWMLKQSQMLAYTTAKSAVHGITRSFTAELGPHGIRINTVMPGWVMTERQKELWWTPEGGRALEEEQPLRGEITPDDLANMLLFLMSDDSRMCSGQEFYVDAGWL